MNKNVISIICSVIVWVMIMLLTGVLGPTAFTVGLIILKVIGSIILLALLIRIPIVLMDRNDARHLNKVREELKISAQASLNGVKGTTLNIVGRDHPLMPPDYDE